MVLAISAKMWNALLAATGLRAEMEALASNLELRAAMARIETARAQVKLSQSDLYPTVDLGVGANRTRSTQSGSNPLPQGFSPYSNDYRIALQASYEVDLWGKFRTATRAA